MVVIIHITLLSALLQPVLLGSNTHSSYKNTF